MEPCCAGGAVRPLLPEAGVTAKLAMHLDIRVGGGRRGRVGGVVHRCPLVAVGEYCCSRINPIVDALLAHAVTGGHDCRGVLVERAGVAVEERQRLGSLGR